MSRGILPRISAEEFTLKRRDPIPAEALNTARHIVEDVRRHGEQALRRYAERFGEIEPGAPLYIDKSGLEAAFRSLSDVERAHLKRAAERIRQFAINQRAALADIEVPVPGGMAGHTAVPVARAGCYAPGGRYPLISSVLMTAVTASVAGVTEIWVASPRPGPLLLAAAALAEADGVLVAGGAHAIAALAFGCGRVGPCDAVVGPGNRYVTAAKQLVCGYTAIDMLAGPSELLVVADQTTNPAVVAADLLAQAEHDPEAVPLLVSLDAALVDEVESEVERQLETLTTAETACEALGNGGVMLVADLDEAVRIADRIAPEHLQLSIGCAQDVASQFTNYGAIFVGENSAVVFGDYGAGPNHVLPTGGTARFQGGLSVLNFLRVRTWLRLDDQLASTPICEDAAWFGRIEGLEGHARAAELRLPQLP